MKSLILNTIAILGFTVASSITAYGDNHGNPLFFYQTDKSKTAVTVGGDYEGGFLSQKKDDKEIKSTTTTILYGLSGEYGVNENISAGASVKGIQETSESDGTKGNEIQGLSDLFIFSKGQYPLGNGGFLHGSIGVSISPGNREVDLKEGKGNGASGGHGVEASIGYAHSLNENRAGAKASFIFSGEKTQKTKDKSGTETEKQISSRMGWRADIFAERELDGEKFVAGVKLFVEGQNETKTKVDDKETSNNDEKIVGGGGLFGRAQFLESSFGKWHVVANVDYKHALSAMNEDGKKLGDVEGSSYSIGGSLGVRLTF